MVEVAGVKLKITLGDRYVSCVKRESGSGRRGVNGICPTKIIITMPRGLVVRYHAGRIRSAADDSKTWAPQMGERMK